MPSFISELTSRYLMNESSGVMVDTIGSKDSDSPAGSPTYNPSAPRPFIRLDGAVDSFGFTSGNSPLDHSGDLTFHFLYSFPTDPDGVNTIPIDGSSSPTTFQQLARWDDLNVTNKFRFAWGNVAGGALDIDAGRLILADEIIANIISYDRTSNDFKYVIKSDHATTPLNLSGTVAIGTDPAVQSMFIGRNKAGSFFTEMDMYDMGNISGTAKSIADMQDTADALLNPTVETPSSAAKQIILLNDF